MSYASAERTQKVDTFILNFLVELTDIDGGDEGLFKRNLYAQSSILSQLRILRADINFKKLAYGISFFFLIFDRRRILMATPAV